MNAPEQIVKVLNIYCRINEVRKKCAYIQKDKKVEGGGNYMATTHDAVTAELRPQLIEQGIIVVPRLISGAVVDTGTTTKNGIPIIRYEAMYEIDFVNMDDPVDRVVVPIASHALDSGDKAPGKAASYATKYAMLKLFSIETGDSEEDRLESRSKAKDGSTLPASKSSGTDGSVEALPPDRQEVIQRTLSSIVDCFDAGQEQEAFNAYSEVTDNDEKIALWHLLKPHSKMRRRIKEMGAVARKLAGEVKPERDPALHRRD